MLSTLLLATLMNPSLLFFILSSSLPIDTSTLSVMLASHLPPFLKTNTLSMSSLGYKTLCIIISFLVLWSVCLSSFLVQFKNGPGYLTRVFIPLMRFLFQSLVSRNFLVCLMQSFLVFSSSPLV